MASVVKRPARAVFYSHKSRHRERLFKQDPHCHWCGRLTKLFTPAPGQKAPGDMATVDHVISRLTRTSRAEYHHKSNKVLACENCNRRRGAEEEERLGHRGPNLAKREVPDYPIKLLTKVGSGDKPSDSPMSPIIGTVT